MDVTVGDFQRNILLPDSNYQNYLSTKGLTPSKATVYIMTKLRADTEIPVTDHVTESGKTPNSYSDSLPDLNIEGFRQTCVNTTPTVEVVQQLKPYLCGKLLCSPETVLQIQFQFNQLDKCFEGTRSCYLWYVKCHPQVEFEQFDPLSCGFRYSNIKVGGQEYLTCVPGEDGTETITLLQANDGEVICSGPDVIAGYCDGKLGLGLLCKRNMGEVHYQWFIDDQEYESGFRKCFIFPDRKGVYRCAVLWEGIHEIPKSIHVVENTEGSNDMEEKIVQEKVSEKPCADCVVIESSSEMVPETILSTRDSFTTPLLCVKKDDISFGNIIGKGGFGIVYEGKWACTKIAIKEIHINRLNLFHESISAELKVISHLRHPNIVLFMSYATEANKLFIVTELIQGHNLEKVLFDYDVEPKYLLSREIKLRIAYQCSCALAYMHAIEPKVIHQDIKPANILIDQVSYTAKLCDLGLAKIKSTSAISITSAYGSIAGTPIYMAPECILYSKLPTTATDVWSLACTLVELFSGKNIWKLPPGDKPMLQLMKSCKVPHALTSLSEDTLYPILCKSLNYTPTQRPTSHYLATLLETTIKQVH